MDNTIKNEAYVFFISIVSGAAGGVIFDIFRGFRKQFRSKSAFVAFQDILFWVISAIMVFAFMYKFNSGQPRWYIFIGITLGLVLYNASISKFVVLITVRILKIFTGVFKLFARITAFIINIFVKPFKILIIPLHKVNRKIKFFLKSKGNNLRKIKKQLKMY